MVFFQAYCIAFPAEFPYESNLTSTSKNNYKTGKLKAFYLNNKHQL